VADARLASVSMETTAQPPVKILRCGGCDREFVPAHPERKNPSRYCSRRCGNRAGRSGFGLRECVACAKLFTARSQVQRYCSQECHRKTIQLPLPKCQRCGCEFKPKMSNRRSFCSRDCFFAMGREKVAAKQAVKANRVLFTRCVQCGSSFEPSAKRMYCSTHCGNKARYNPLPPKDFQCAFCGIFFQRGGRAASGGRGGRCGDRYCCRSHRVKHNRIKERMNGKRYEQKTRRNERIRAQWVEAVDPQKVFQRDEWACWLCDQKCNPNAVYPDPAYPTLDHITPVSKGGEHSYANCRCACLKCNYRLSAKDCWK
jgi:hypothetical protein